MGRVANQQIKTILTIVTFIALVGFVYAIRNQIVDTFQNLEQVNIWVLAFMPFWQFINYHAYTMMYQQFYSVLGERIRYKSLFRLTLELNFINNIFPSGGVSGFSYYSIRMKDADVPTGKSTLVQLAKYITIFISFQILLAIGLLFLAFDGRAGGLVILVAGSIATLLAVGTFLLAYIIGSKRRINEFFTFVTKVINKIIHTFRRGHPETINIERTHKIFDDLHENYMQLRSNMNQLKKPLLWGVVANLSEVLTIYTVYVAFGSLVNPGAVILAYAVANFAGLVSVLPGGVGIYEFLMTVVLAASGVSPALSVPVTLMYRILNMLIQLPPGYYFYHKALHRNTQ
jgi:uncharacterized protein (TIRG00374 family)